MSTRPLERNGLPWQNANYDYENANYWNMTMSALSADGVLSSYSTVGSNIFLTAPGGLDRGIPGHTTTTMTCDWYKKAYPNIVVDCAVLDAFNIQYEYTPFMNGTSAAAPNASGAIALLMSAANEQNHELTAREIRHLLAQTATKIDAEHSDIIVNDLVGLEGWSQNAAGVNFSPFYGFGLVDVDKAVELIRRYAIENLPSALVKTSWYGLEREDLTLTILDNATTTSSTVTVADDLIIEAVQIRLDVDHSRMADLKVELESPNGTRSILMSPYNHITIW